MHPRLTFGLENTVAASGRLQPALWDLWQKRTRTGDITEDGIYCFKDFDNWGARIATDVYTDGWVMNADTGSTIVQALVAGGVIRPTTDATDNDSIDIMYANVGNMTITAASAVAVAFDWRVRFTQVTDTYNAFFGLTATGSAADNGFFSDAGATADRACVGFTVLEADGDALEFTWKKAGQTAQITTGLKVIAGAVWYQLGFIFDPAETNPARRGKVFIDNAIVAYLTDAQIVAATFPTGILVGPGFSLKNQTTAAKSFDIDCCAWAMAQ